MKHEAYVAVMILHNETVIPLNQQARPNSTHNHFLEENTVSEAGVGF